jgi:FMN phosphatase YigB (HAD superfamily)
MYGAGMEEDRIEAVVLASHGTIVNWCDGVEAVLYEVARMHGESPLDRGRALRRRLEALQRSGPFAWAFDALAAERGYRWVPRGETAFERVVRSCRVFADAAPALTSVRAAGLRVIAVGGADPQLVDAALRPLDGAFDEVLPAVPLGRAAAAIGVPAGRVLHVATTLGALRTAASLGMRSAWLNRNGAPAPEEAVFDVEWRSLESLGAWVAGRRPVGAMP